MKNKIQIHLRTYSACLLILFSACQGSVKKGKQNGTENINEKYKAYLELYKHQAKELPGYSNQGPHKAICLEIPKLELERMGQDVPPLNLSNIQRTIDFVAQKHDRANFGLLHILRVLYRYGDSEMLPQSMLDSMKQVVLNHTYWLDEPGDLNMCYCTENHIIAHHTGELLAGQLYPDEVFANNGRDGNWHREHATPLIHKWFDWRARFGFSEWNCGYYNVNLATIAELLDFAEDPEIQRLSLTLIDEMMFHMAVHSHGSHFGSTSGRRGAPGVLGNYHIPTRLVQNLVFDKGPTGYMISPFAITLATSSYQVPPVIYAIANHTPENLVARERHSLNVEEAASFGVDPANPGNLWFFWGAQVWNHRSVIENSMEQCPPRHWLYNRFERANARYRHCENTGISCDPDPNHQALTEANVYTFRTPQFMLSCAQDYRKGKPGFQQHIWQATLDDNAIVFATNPASGKTDHGRPGHWTGNRFMPRAAAYRNVLVSIWQFKPEEMDDPVTHAFFPRERFDEWKQQSGWLFGRKNDGYVALYSLNPVKWEEPRKEDIPLMKPLDAEPGWKPGPYEVVAQGAENVWICELGNPDLYGSFDKFIQAISKTEIAGNAQQISYQSPTVGEVVFGWTGPLQVEGKTIQLADYPRFDNPFCTADFNTKRFEIQYDGKQHLLDYRTKE